MLICVAVVCAIRIALEKQRDLLVAKIAEFENEEQGSAPLKNTEKKHTREYNKASNKASMVIAEIAFNRSKKKSKR